MNTNELKKAILNKNAQFTALQWSRPCKTLKGCTDEIIKTVKARNIRIGAGYDNMKAVKEGRANGELPTENQGLKGKKWIEYPYILQSIYNDTEYVRIETAKNSVFETEYTKNGVRVTKSEIADLLYANEKAHREMPTVMDINLDNITNIN